MRVQREDAAEPVLNQPRCSLPHWVTRTRAQKANVRKDSCAQDGDDGDVGIIRSPLRAIVLPDPGHSAHRSKKSDSAVGGMKKKFDADRRIQRPSVIG